MYRGPVVLFGVRRGLHRGSLISDKLSGTKNPIVKREGRKGRAKSKVDLCGYCKRVAVYSLYYRGPVDIISLDHGGVAYDSHG